MIFLCITLLLLHQGYAEILVTTVQLGGPAHLKCVFSDVSQSSITRVKWYRQRIGGTLTLITTLITGVEQPAFEQGFHPSQYYANSTQTMSTLAILKTVEEDEALYHCAVTNWNKNKWIGTYLSFEGNTRRTRDSAVVQWPAVPDPVHLGDSVTLQCSVLSDSEPVQACPGEYSVHWFGVRSDKSHPNIIYNGGNRHDECEERTDSRKSCVYRFSKNVTSSDAGTYYCAVATCGEILFGNGTKLDIKETGLGSLSDNIFLLLLCAVLAISVNVAAFLIYAIKKNKCDYCNNEAAVLLLESVAKRKLKRNEDAWMYSTVVFNVMKSAGGGTRDAKAAERERIYAAVKAFGLD
ncbi:uncharacterized protein LOC117737684 isoform X2 [Cyclopterus lumpus]|uniref:uncharacterized protein LOC117737684 isoform X2 n=1 Tax=Cyclopterus lumpus TaxID=8103 RepID=UPI00148708B8|nr:uncharacterized protein LOC117737684 isoform X2 [Cyclopterus lumpus]